MKMIFVDPATDVNINVPNMALAYAAARTGAKVIDQHVLALPRDRFLRCKADVVGISVRSFTRAEAVRVKSRYEKKFPGVPVKSVSGFLDVQCCYPFENLDDNIAFDETFSDALPFPRYELFDSCNYMSANWAAGLWSYPIMTSHGCPYRCVFCAARNRKWLARSPGNCAAELKLAKEKYGIKSFEIIDDAFNVDKNRALEFSSLVGHLRLEWACVNGLRADRFDEELAREMADAGCRHVGFGAETCDDKILSTLQKGETWGDISSAVSAAKKHIPKVSAFFIIGLPGSSYESDMRALKWARDEGVRAHFSYFAPEFSSAGPSGEVFYGSSARPKSDAYPKDMQTAVYDAAKKLRARAYGRERLAIKVFFSMLKAVPRYNTASLLTHVASLVRIGARFIFKKEIS